MCAMSVLCPLCERTNFQSIDELRGRLIKSANGPLPCPICGELFLGLDKLTIHLFSHNTTFSENTKINLSKTINGVKTTTTTSTTTTSSITTTTTTATATATATATKSNKTKRTKKQTTALTKNKNVTLTPPHLVDATGTTVANSEFPAICDICELSFSNEQLRDMHYRLVHQNIDVTTITTTTKTTKTAATAAAATSTILANKNTNNNNNNNNNNNLLSKEPDFKCHLCAKVFKMKGSLRVHLKVVHLMGLSHVNNSPKLNICERIRRQRDEQQPKVTTTNMNNFIATQQQQQNDHGQGLGQTEDQRNVVSLNPLKMLKTDLITSQTKPTTATTATIPAATTTTITTTTITPTTTISTSTFSMTNVIIKNMNETQRSPTATATMGMTTKLNISGKLITPLQKKTNDLIAATAVAGTSNILLVFTGNTNNDTNSIDAINSTTLTTTTTTTTTTISTPKLSPKSSPITFDKEALNMLMYNNSDNKIWSCDICTKSFTTKYFLKKHKRLHTGEMPYACEICSRTFTFQQSYHKHLLYHSDEKPHVCGTCGRAFKELSTLHNHERIHSGEKPFKCEVCGKSFRQRVSFLVHTRIHTGIMPYKCEICQKSFRYKVSQRTHKCALKITENSDPTINSPTKIPKTTLAAETLVQSTNTDQMSDSFIKEFLENNTTTENANNHLSTAHSPSTMEIMAINVATTTPKSVTPVELSMSELHKTTLAEEEALLSKTIDDIVVESCHKMGIGVINADNVALNTFNSQQQIVVAGSHNALSATDCVDCESPLEKLQQMRLYSPQLITEIENLDNGNFTRFLFDVDDDDDQNNNSSNNNNNNYNNKDNNNGNGNNRNNCNRTNNLL